MSTTLQLLARCLREREPNPDLHVVASGSGPLELSLEDPAPETQTAEVVEPPHQLLARPVPAGGGASGFTHFLDGKQESHLVFYWGLVPVVYAWTGAVIRERGPDGAMRTWGREEQDEALYSCLGLLPEELRRDLLGAGITLRDASEGGDDAATLPGLLRAIRNAVGRHRAGLERRLAERWVDAHGPDGSAVLMVDGGLRDIFQSTRHPHLVGVVKSCTTHYFPPPEQARCYHLRVGERTSVFTTPKGQRTSVHSWYQRLFDHRGSDLAFGLVRLEVSPGGEITRRADRVSQWLLAERAPLSKPDPRWDRMAYTIYDCEQYLRSIMPSRQMIAGLLASLRP